MRARRGERSASPTPQLDLCKGMMDCLYAHCTPCITDCVMAELEKLGTKYRVSLRVAKDPRIERLPCTHTGTYADDCLCERVAQARPSRPARPARAAQPPGPCILRGLRRLPPARRRSAPGLPARSSPPARPPAHPPPTHRQRPPAITARASTSAPWKGCLPPARTLTLPATAGSPCAAQVLYRGNLRQRPQAAHPQDPGSAYYVHTAA